MDKTTIAGMPIVIDATMAADEFKIAYPPKYEAHVRPGGDVFAVTQQLQPGGDTLVRVTFAPDILSLRCRP